jgi:hypothetical protein
MKHPILIVPFLMCVLCESATYGRGDEHEQLPEWKSLLNSKDPTGWVDVNPSPET